MAGKNKGKKYIKLRGGEVATPENQERALAFWDWYAKNCEVIRGRLIYEHLYDDEVATDTAINIYEIIAFKGAVIANFKFYFLRAYHTNLIAAIKRRDAMRWEDLDRQLYTRAGDPAAGKTLADTLAAPTFDYAQYEESVDALKNEMTQYVRDNYPPADASLFEIYIALQPSMSYKSLARLLGFPDNQVWPILGAIRKDLARRFEARKDFLLSLVQ